MNTEAAASSPTTAKNDGKAVSEKKDETDQLQHMIALALASYGFAFHLKSLGKPALPLILALVLGPLRLLETGLRALTAA